MGRAGFMIAVLGYLMIVLGVLAPFVGCVAGGSAGFRATNGPAPIGPASLFDSQDPPDRMPEFWVVQYPIVDADSSRPRLIELTDPDRVSSDWYYGPPRAHSRLTTGPWDTSGYAPDDPALTSMTPIGDLEISAGGVSFTSLDDGSSRAELIVYPTDRPDGWTRWYYTYDLSDGSVIPVRAFRETDTSDFTIEGMLAFGIGGFGIGVIISVILIIIGLVLVSAGRSKGSR